MGGKRIGETEDALKGNNLSWDKHQNTKRKTTVDHMARAYLTVVVVVIKAFFY